MKTSHITSARLVLGAIAVASLGVVAAACGGDDAAPATSPTVASAATTASSTIAPTIAPTAPAVAAIVKVGTTTKGAALTDSAGLTLYTFDNDTIVGKSACNAGCATNWPPLITTLTGAPSGITGATGTFSIITRDDSAKQLAYNNKPLYRWNGDKAPGDILGDGVGGIWHIAAPVAALAVAPVKVGTTAKGSALTDAAGLTLYTFDNDKTPGKSSCNGGCAITWPPVITTAAAPPSGVMGAASPFTIITRDDGTKQLAYNARPLYRFAADTASGQTGGDGVGGVWHIAAP